MVSYVIPSQDQEGMLSFKDCLVDLGRMLLLVVEQVFLPMGEFWWMHNANIKCTICRKRDTFFMFNFFLSYYKIWILFHIDMHCFNVYFMHQIYYRKEENENLKNIRDKHRIWGFLWHLDCILKPGVYCFVSKRCIYWNHIYNVLVNISPLFD